MKNIKLLSALALSLGVLAAGAASAASSTGGTITFDGVVTDSTCPVNGGVGTDGGAGNFSVRLPQVATTDLATVNAKAGTVPFTIDIGTPGDTTPCAGAGKVARVTFLTSSPNINGVNGMLNNALSGEASNVNVQLLSGTGAGTVIDLTTQANFDGSAFANGVSKVPFQAQYVAVGGAATAGLVQTSVIYGLSYN